MASIEKRGDRSWRLVVSGGFDASGKRIKYTRTIRIDDEDILRSKRRLREYLEAELVRFRAEIEAQTWRRPERVFFKDFVREWEEKYAREHLAPGTLEAYRLHLKNHILPVFGELEIGKIRPFHIVSLMSDLKAKNLAPGTVAYIYRVLRNVMSRAAEWGFVTENPAASVKRPKGETVRTMDVYSEEEVQALFKAAEKEAPHWRMFLTLALAAGLRRGELLALEWRHVDLEAGTIRIEQSLSRGEKGRPLLKPPKSRTSVRSVSVPPSVVHDLRAYRKHWLEERLRVGDLWEEYEHEFLFHNGYGRPFYPTTADTWWRRFTRRAGVRYVRLHDLRHTAATLLIAQGVHARIIAERLGHADIRTTMTVYGHVLREADQSAAAKIDHLFKMKNGDTGHA